MLGKALIGTGESSGSVLPMQLLAPNIGIERRRRLFELIWCARKHPVVTQSLLHEDFSSFAYSFRRVDDGAYSWLIGNNQAGHLVILAWDESGEDAEDVL